MSERIKWIDIAKGIAIIMVVMGHVVVSYHNVHQYETSTLFNFSYLFGRGFRMPLFMLISGMLQYRSQLSKRGYSLTKVNTGGVRSRY